jgi:hypothetical protein
MLGIEYFGARLDMEGWKTTNDAWYHIDFTPQWNRALLFENALSKVRPGGFLVLVTDRGNVDNSMELVGLKPVPGQIFSLKGGVQVGAYVWRR